MLPFKSRSKVSNYQHFAVCTGSMGKAVAVFHFIAYVIDDLYPDSNLDHKILQVGKGRQSCMQ